MKLTDKDFISSWHLYILKINYAHFGFSRNDLMCKLKKHNIGTQVHYIPLYRQPYYMDRFNISEKQYPCAEAYYEQALSIPIYSGLKGREVKEVMDVFKRILGQ